MASRLEPLRGLIQITAKHIDLADNATSPEQKAHSAALTRWLLPIAKALGDEFSRIGRLCYHGLGGGWPCAI